MPDSELLEYLKKNSFHIMKPDEIGLFGTVAGKAYPLDYPLFTYFFGKKVNTQKIIDAFILCYSTSSECSICYSFEDVSKGNVMFETPESVSHGKSKILCSAFFKILFKYGPRPLIRMSKFDKLAKKLIGEIKEKNLIYFQNLVISKEYQGHNLIEDLAGPIIAYADRIGATICFETFTMSNVGMYKHYGFELTMTVPLPDSEIEMYFLKRTPNNELQ